MVKVNFRNVSAISDEGLNYGDKYTIEIFQLYRTGRWEMVKEHEIFRAWRWSNCNGLGPSSTLNNETSNLSFNPLI